VTEGHCEEGVHARRGNLSESKPVTPLSTSTSTSTFTSSWLEFVPDRPGHDFRYALDNAKIRKELGWQPEIRLEDGLSKTVDWYREHPKWWQPLKQRLERESKGFWTDAAGVVRGSKFQVPGSRTSDDGGER